MDEYCDHDHSIIHQLTRVFNVPNQDKIFCKKLQWKVAFVGESTINVDYSTCDLLTEASMSIFEPTTKLSIPIPYMRNHQE